MRQAYLVLLILSHVAGATCDERYLTDLSLPEAVAAPRKPLVYLKQLEAHDPFNFFQEGLDPENENPLDVSNERGLEVHVGGAAFRDGEVDGVIKFSIKPLAFTTVSQRYLVSANEKRVVRYQLLINVDRQAKAAHVYMRQRGAKKLSDWALVASYGETPSNAGLIGDADQGKRLMTLGRDENGPTLDVRSGPHELARLLTRVSIDEPTQLAIARGDLEALAGRSVALNGGEISFRIDGADHQGRSRLGVRIKKGPAELKLSSCVTWRPGHAEPAGR